VHKESYACVCVSLCVCVCDCVWNKVKRGAANVFADSVDKKIKAATVLNGKMQSRGVASDSETATTTITITFSKQCKLYTSLHKEWQTAAHTATFLFYFFFSFNLNNKETGVEISLLLCAMRRPLYISSSSNNK